MDQEHPAGLLRYDNELRLQGFTLIAGVDEAGRGPLAGPVVAAAVILPDGVRLPGLNDSKKLSAAKRETLAVQIKKTALAWAVGLATVSEIERENIHRASLWAMKRAVRGLEIVPHYLLVDGRALIPDLPVSQRALAGGDGLSAAVAAASILAKVTRDHLMRTYHHVYPEYGFDRHKGYPTAAHLEKLSAFGPCPIHRAGFRPVKELSEAGGRI